MVVSSTIQPASNTSKSAGSPLDNIKPAKGFDALSTEDADVPFSEQNPLLGALSLPTEHSEGSAVTPHLNLNGVVGEQAESHATANVAVMHSLVHEKSPSGLGSSPTMALGTTLSDAVRKDSPQTLPVHRGINTSLLSATASPLAEHSLPQPATPTPPSKTADVQSLILNMQPSAISGLPVTADLSLSVSTATAPNISPPATSTVQTSAEWAPIRVDTQAGKWGEQMMQVLQDRVTLQANQNLQEARIRLDPPDLGKLDVIVRVEGDRLNVQLNASAVATREALVQVSERLRAELQSEHFVHVDVNVGSEQHERKNQEPDESPTGIFSSREVGGDNETHYFASEHWLNVHA
ncbi:flagellar hook-length control protein FliK [Enterovibrio sp. ZSDZ35]|uniref:Flagellar hook-length control protein FliK n=1 Tax=Enterovibrio qingdaonensis TaxID=2899818 RepID=A0ABT5QLL7_9GAMM|nr:flagellar hook-length control protein FliK [Enterovibrio sp. ZSDZ35]MDD1781872.1 flagellar hook-length control protein FliK [Enterovibrio sp. ZSDZ35]